MLDGLGAKYEVVELNEVADGPGLRAELGSLVGRTSVPAVWINGQFVGGCNDEDDGGGDVWRTARFFGSRVGYLRGGSAGARFPIDNLFAFNKKQFGQSTDAERENTRGLACHGTNHLGLV